MNKNQTLSELINIKDKRFLKSFNLYLSRNKLTFDKEYIEFLKNLESSRNFKCPYYEGLGGYPREYDNNLDRCCVCRGSGKLGPNYQDQTEQLIRTITKEIKKRIGEFEELLNNFKKESYGRI